MGGACGPTVGNGRCGCVGARRVRVGVGRQPCTGAPSAFCAGVSYPAGVWHWHGHAAVRAGEAGAYANGWVLGGKTALVEPENGAAAFTLAYGASYAQPSRGQAYAWGNVAINAVFTQTLAPDWTGHVNVGWTRDRIARQSSTTWAVAGEWAATPWLDVVAEVYGDDRQRPWLGAGLRWTASKAWSWNVSYAVQNDAVRTRLVGVGVKFSFD